MKINCFQVHLVHICIQMFKIQVQQKFHLRGGKKEQKGTHRNFFYNIFIIQDQCDKFVQINDVLLHLTKSSSKKVLKFETGLLIKTFLYSCNY